MLKKNKKIKKQNLEFLDRYNEKIVRKIIYICNGNKLLY